MSTALRQPHRTELPTKLRRDDGSMETIHPRDHRAGYALGRLRLQDLISNDQLIAGNRYTELALRHMQHITGHLPKFPSQAINDTVKGLACTADISNDDAIALRRSWADAQAALVENHQQHAYVSALASVCVMDRDLRSDAELGYLREALNLLHRLWK